MALLRRDDEWCPAVRGDRLVHISATLQERIDQVHMALARSDEEQRRALVLRKGVAIDVARVGMYVTTEPVRQPSGAVAGVAGRADRPPLFTRRSQSE